MAAGTTGVIPEAPIFRPTEEEFADPMRFITSIRKSAEQFGICKIVPPRSWRPPFCFDPKRFQFATRIQKLNEMDGLTRVKVDLVESLMRFHQQIGQPLAVAPVVGGKPLDFYRLRSIVHSLGGFEAVTEGRLWTEVSRSMGFDECDAAAAQSSLLKSNYLKWLAPFDDYLRLNRGRRKPTSSSGKQEFPSSSKRYSLRKTLAIHSKNRESSDTQLSPNTARRSRRSRKTSPEPLVLEKCLACDKVVRDWPDSSLDVGEEVECARCNSRFHCGCLLPPLAQPPDCDWFCADCLAAGEDYAFEEGGVYTLEQFKLIADRFKSEFCRQHSLVEDDCTVMEREFWRLCQSVYDEGNVQVEYGADLHSSELGSGFPQPATGDGSDKYSKSPWNLNNIAKAPGSLLRLIDRDVCGMTLPWVYVGMCFSAFCWHAEDHNTYSINYLHCGQPKTWYGVPSSDADLLEETMRDRMPDLFMAQPDLLFHITTMIPPEKLMEAGVHVFTCNQRAGEFMLTFPRAYHGGFNQGFNVAEAVNFTLPDWFMLGVRSAILYKQFKRTPVFSHDHLLTTFIQKELNENTAHWLVEPVNEMCERELAERKSLKRRVRKIRLTNCDEEPPLDQTETVCDQCSGCQCFCYLSWVESDCVPGKIACADHAQELCQCGKPCLRLVCRFSDSHLSTIVREVINCRQRAIDRFEQNVRNYFSHNQISEPDAPEKLLAEGQRIEIPPSNAEIQRLETRCLQIRDWTAQASAIISRPKRFAGRAGKILGLKQSDAGDGTAETETLMIPTRTQAHLERIISLADPFNYDCKQLHDLWRLQSLAESFRSKAQVMLEGFQQQPQGETDHTKLEAVDSLVNEGLALELDDLPELGALENLKVQILWAIRSRRRIDSIESCQRLIDEAASLQIPTDWRELKQLQLMIDSAVRWQSSFRELFDKTSVLTADKLRQLLLALQQPAFGENSACIKETDHRWPDLVQVDAERARLLLRRHQELCKRLRQSLDVNLANSSLSIDGAERLLQEARALPLPLDGGVDDEVEIQLKRARSWLSTDAAAAGLGAVLRKTTEAVSALIAARPSLSNELYCICLSKSDAGFMVCCDICEIWYHGKCISVRGDLADNEQWSCPVCRLLGSKYASVYDENGTDVCFSSEHTLIDFHRLAEAERSARSVECFVRAERAQLSTICSALERWMTTARCYFSNNPGSPCDLNIVRWFLRQMLGIEKFIRLPSPFTRSLIAAGRELAGSSSSPAAVPFIRQLYESTSSQQQQPIYCLCKQPYDEQTGESMIGCDSCDNWFHLKCVGLTAAQADKIDSYVCPSCKVHSLNERKQSQSQPPTSLASSSTIAKASKVKQSTKAKQSLLPSPSISTINSEVTTKRQASPEPLPPHPPASSLTSSATFITKRHRIHSNNSTNQFGIINDSDAENDLNETIPRDRQPSPPGSSGQPERRDELDVAHALLFLPFS